MEVTQVTDQIRGGSRSDAGDAESDSGPTAAVERQHLAWLELDVDWPWSARRPGGNAYARRPGTPSLAFEQGIGHREE